MPSTTSLLRKFSLIVAALALIVSAQDVSAQLVRIPAAALADASAVQTAIVQGSELEKERQWSEAVAVYQEALRDHPGNSVLRERLETARLHLDVSRRYSDTSFHHTLTRLNPEQSLALYEDVLNKVHANYVHEPNWAEMVRRGARQLDVALTEPDFVNLHLAGVPAEKVAAFRAELAEVMKKYGAYNRADARTYANYVASLAGQNLGLSKTTVVMEFACAAVGGLDDYSAFLTRAQLEDIFSQIKGNFVGLGIELKAENDALLIVNVISGGPAAQGGIRAGDRIVEIDGTSMKHVSTDSGADLLKGVEGSAVTIKVVSPGQQPRTIQLQRRRVELPSIEDANIVDQENGIAYLRMPAFQETTAADLNAALWDLHRQGMRSLIIDLRGNPGGLLNAAVEAADKFISSGTIVSTRGRSAREDYDYKARQSGTWRVPLVVLIDRDSASASEIFAGAIADHRRGYIVGEKSYGKGSVQGIFRVNSSDVGVRLTTAKFYSPSGQAISKRGVSPTIKVQVAAKPLPNGDLSGGESADAALQAGIQAAKRLIAQR